MFKKNLCHFLEYLFTEIQYYITSEVTLHNEALCFTLEWTISIYLQRGSPYIEFVMLFLALNAPQSVFRK